MNPMGQVHGGWLLTLIDSATGVAAQTLMPAGKVPATIETKGNFSRPIQPATGIIRCEARVISSGRQIISCQALIIDQAGRVLGHGVSTIMAVDAPDPQVRNNRDW